MVLQRRADLPDLGVLVDLVGGHAFVDGDVALVHAEGGHARRGLRHGAQGAQPGADDEGDVLRLHLGTSILSWDREAAGITLKRERLR